MGCSNLFANKLSHDTPYAYLAGDAVHHHLFAQMTKEQGGYLSRPGYMFLGYNDTIPYNPVIIEHLSAGFSHISGLETYDSIYLLQFLMGLGAVLIMYFIIRRFNIRVAMLSLPFSLLLFTGKYYTAFTWGKWELIPAQLFLIGFFWSLSYFKEKWSPYLTGLFLGASFMCHVIEGIWGIGFLFIFVGLGLIRERKDYIKENWKKYLIIFVVFILMTGYYLPIFKNSHYSARQGVIFRISTSFDAGSPIPFFKELGIFWIFFIIAIAFFILSKDKKENIWFLIPVYMLAISLTNYIGFDKSLITRLIWPIYLMPLFGFGIYIMLSKVIENRNIIFSISTSLLLIGIVFFGMYNVISTPGMVNPYHWEALNWIKDNTPEDSNVLFFYGDLYGQGKPLYYCERLSYRIVNQYIEEEGNYLFAMTKNQTLRYYNANAVFFKKGEGLYRKGFFSFGHHFVEDNINTTALYNSKIDICDFDYIVLDRVTSNIKISQYNMDIANWLVSKEVFVPVFQNNFVIILKYRGECNV